MKSFIFIISVPFPSSIIQMGNFTNWCIVNSFFPVFKNFINCCLNEISRCRHSRIISHPVTLFWQLVNQLLHWTTLYMSSAWQGSFNNQFEIFGLTRSGIEPGPPRQGANALTTRLPSWCLADLSILVDEDFKNVHVYDKQFDIWRHC